MFRALLLILALLAPAEARAQPAHAHQHGSTMGVHGMVIFGGRDGLFAAHLPLFRAPHDRQIVLRLAVDDPAVDRTVRAELATGALWTLEPERFELARLYRHAPDPLRAFRASLYRGHFERGGKVVHKAVPVRVEAVLIDRALDPAMRPASVATYDLIGRGDAAFLVKRLDARPDFDHVVAVTANRGAPRELRIPHAAIAAPDDAVLHGAARGKLRVRRTVYFETEDLK